MEKKWEKGDKVIATKDWINPKCPICVKEGKMEKILRSFYLEL